MTAPDDRFIELRRASKVYGQGDTRVAAINDLTLTIARGDFVALIGPSGSGKSTLLNVIGGLDSLTTGEFLVGGTSLHDLDERGRARYRHTCVGFIFQGFNLLRRTSAIENVELPLLYRGVPRAERRRRALEALNLVGLATRTDHTASQLSGGQQQRVAIARALAVEPLLLIADEPTGNLDSAQTQEILSLLAALPAKNGTTLIMVTHEPEVAARARRVLEFRDGRMTADRLGGKLHAA